MSRTRTITAAGTFLAFLVGIFVPATAAAWGACTEGRSAVDDALQASEFLRTSIPSAKMSMRVEKPERSEPDCSTIDQFDESDPSFAACYDTVDIPISTIPSLFAQHQADEASSGVLKHVGGMIGREFVETATLNPDEASVELTTEERIEKTFREVARDFPKREAVCTSASPDTCERAPAPLTIWFPEITSPSAAESMRDVELDPAPEAPTVLALGGRTVRPVSPARDVPVPPPR